MTKHALVAGVLIAIAPGLTNMTWSQLPFPPPEAETETEAETFSKYVDKDGTIRLPENFRQEWMHIGSWSVAKKQGEDVHEFHDVFTPKEIVEEFNRTGQWPDGAPMVKELRHASSAKLNTGWAAAPGDVKLWFVMIKDQKRRFKGHKDWGKGWGWAQFNADDPKKNVSKNYRISCLGCHIPRKNMDWVYLEGYPLLTGPEKKE